MAFCADGVADLLSGPLRQRGDWPLSLCVLLGDLRPAFLPKGCVGRGHRAIARNGRVLLASQRTLAELVGKVVQLRLQTWHRALLPGDRAEPYGVLLCVQESNGEPEYEVTLERPPCEAGALQLVVEGKRLLQFRPLARARGW